MLRRPFPMWSLAQQAEWSVERDSLQQQVSAERQQGQERAARLEEQLTALQTERDTEHTSAQARIVSYSSQLSLALYILIHKTVSVMCCVVL